MVAERDRIGACPPPPAARVGRRVCRRRKRSTRIVFLNLHRQEHPACGGARPGGALPDRAGGPVSTRCSGEAVRREVCAAVMAGRAHTYIFIIVGKKDNPIYEVEFTDKVRAAVVGRWWGGGAEVVGRWRRAHHAAYDLLLAERRRLERVCGGDVVRCRDGAGAARRVRDEQRLRWRLR